MQKQILQVSDQIGQNQIWIGIREKNKKIKTVLHIYYQPEVELIIGRVCLYF